MGVDISMSMGWGIHFSQQEIDDWLGEDDEDGAYEGLDTLLSDHDRLTFSYAGDAWTGDDQGFVVYARDTYKHFDMGRGTQGGVYRASKSRLGLPEQFQLDAVGVQITGKHLPIEWLVTVGVS